MKMMPPDVISHENQLQHLSEPSIFMLDVFRTADHAGQIFIPHRLADFIANTIAFIVLITVPSFVLIIFDQVSGSLLGNMSEVNVGLFLSLCWNIIQRPGDLNFEHFDRRRTLTTCAVESARYYSCTANSLL